MSQRRPQYHAISPPSGWSRWPRDSTGKMQIQKKNAKIPRQCKPKRKNANTKGKTPKSHDNANPKGKTQTQKEKRQNATTMQIQKAKRKHNKTIRQFNWQTLIQPAIPNYLHSTGHICILPGIFAFYQAYLHSPFPSAWTQETKQYNNRCFI